MIAIVDYGMGNLYSVRCALERLGFSGFVTADPDDLERARGIILPGVGAFGDAMANLRRRGLDRALVDAAQAGKPLLGICLGMQLLFEESEEHGRHAGLGLLPGRVVRFRGPFKIPHMGWNRLRYLRASPLLAGVPEGYVYFVHSYYVAPEARDILLAACDYHGEVPAIVGRGRLFGMQFHPEKSGKTGLALLANFARLCGAPAAGRSQPVTEGERR